MLGAGGAALARPLPAQARGPAVEAQPSVDVIGRFSVERFGAVGDGISDNTAAINAAANAAMLAGGHVAFPPGTYLHSGTLIFACDVEDYGATLSFTGSGVAVQIGTNTSGVRLFRKVINLPRVVFAKKPTTGWSTSTIGVKLINVNYCDVYLRHVQGFETGVLAYGKGQGTAYTTIRIGHLDNNKRNLQADADQAGWSNQNTVIGGAFSHNSGEGKNVPGTRHVLFSDIVPNGDPNSWTFLGCSFESPTVYQYALDVYGSGNLWLNCRWEFTAGSPKVLWTAGATRNWIIGGVQVDSIVETHTPGSFANNRLGGGSYRLMPNVDTGLQVENTGSSSGAHITGLRAGGTSAKDDPATAWLYRLQSSQLRGKQASDANDRVRVDFSNGRLYVGLGGATPISTYWSAGGAGTLMLLTGGNLGFGTDNANDIGAAAASRPRDVHVGRNVIASGNLTAKAPGGGLNVKEGPNARMGAATLVHGTVTVGTTAVSANSRILLTVQSLGTVTTPKAIAVTTRTAGASFTITSADGSDTSLVAWMIVEPA
jgi:hypothetical protein